MISPEDSFWRRGKGNPEMACWSVLHPLYLLTVIVCWYLKWYYDENYIFPIKVILKHKQVACTCMRSKMLFIIFNYLFQRCSSFQNMQISEKMTSYTQSNFDQQWWKEISQPICIINVWFLAKAKSFYLMCSTMWA